MSRSAILRYYLCFILGSFPQEIKRRVVSAFSQYPHPVSAPPLFGNAVHHKGCSTCICGKTWFRTYQIARPKGHPRIHVHEYSKACATSFYRGNSFFHSLPNRFMIRLTPWYVCELFRAFNHQFFIFKFLHAANALEFCKADIASHSFAGCTGHGHVNLALPEWPLPSASVESTFWKNRPNFRQVRHNHLPVKANFCRHVVVGINAVWVFHGLILWSTRKMEWILRRSERSPNNVPNLSLCLKGSNPCGQQYRVQKRPAMQGISFLHPFFNFRKYRMLFW